MSKCIRSNVRPDEQGKRSRLGGGRGRLGCNTASEIFTESNYKSAACEDRHDSLTVGDHRIKHDDMKLWESKSLPCPCHMIAMAMG